MAIRRINVTPDTPSSIQTVELGGVEYRLRLKWRDRLDAWYASLFAGENDEIPVRYEERIEPQQLLFEHQVPPELGVWYVAGPKIDYDRHDLGSNLNILWFSTDI